MGWSHLGYAPLGMVLLALFTNVLAIVPGYDGYKSGGILLAACLRPFNHQVTAFIVVLGHKFLIPPFLSGLASRG